MSICDGRRPAGLEHRDRPGHQPRPACGSATWSAAWCSSSPAWAARHHRRHHLLVWIGVFMAVLGLGLGATMQNLVLAVQNNISQADMGAASSVVAFFRSIGGSVGVSVLGALLAHQVSAKVLGGSRRAWASTARPPERGHPGPRRRCRRRSAPSTRPRSARRPATSSWPPCRSRSLPSCSCCYPRGPAAHHARARRCRHEPATSRDSSRRPADERERTESLRRLEAEVGVLIRRIRRVIHERARAVHEDLQPTSYLLLGWLVDEGRSAPRRSPRASASTRAPSRASSSTSSTSAWSPARRTRPTAARRWSRPATTPYAGWPTSPTTVASGSTSSWATGPPPSSTTSSTRSAATTRALNPDVQTEPDGGVRRQQPAVERAARDHDLARRQLDRLRRRVEHDGQAAAAQNAARRRRRSSSSTLSPGRSACSRRAASARR